jgi:hypothetical protein
LYTHASPVFGLCFKPHRYIIVLCIYFKKDYHNNHHHHYHTTTTLTMDATKLGFDTCPSLAPFLGYMGVMASIVLASEF